MLGDGCDQNRVLRPMQTWGGGLGPRSTKSRALTVPQGPSPHPRAPSQHGPTPQAPSRTPGPHAGSFGTGDSAVLPNRPLTPRRAAEALSSGAWHRAPTCRHPHVRVCRSRGTSTVLCSISGAVGAVGCRLDRMAGTALCGQRAEAGCLAQRAPY